jgi:hypothetical protein
MRMRTSFSRKRKHFHVFCTASVLISALLLGGCGFSDSDGSTASLIMPYTESSSDLSDTVSSAAESTPNATDSYPAAETAAPNLSGFAHDQLSAERQNLYAQIYSGISEEKSTFSVNADSTEEIGTVINAVLTDHPEFFWIDGSASIHGIDGIPLKLVQLNFNVDVSQIDSIRSQIEAAADGFLSGIQEGWGEYDIVKYAYEWVIYNTDYQIDSSQDQNIQSVFLNHVSVCAGYAKAMQYLLQKAGVFCTYIKGTILPDNATHAWNLVRIDGTYTLVDATWGDPTYGSNAEDESKLSIIYDYLCVTTEEMNRTHTPSGAYVIPECTSQDYDYYRLNGEFYESSDEDLLSKALWNSVDNNSTLTYMKFPSDEIYEEAFSKIFDGGLINEPLQQRLKWDGRKEMKYYYSRNDNMYVLKIYWS